MRIIDGIPVFGETVDAGAYNVHKTVYLDRRWL